MKKLVSWFAATTVLLGLAACGVPDSGNPVAVREEQAHEVTSAEVNVVIPQPRQGASPVETFTSFLAAGGITQNRTTLANTFIAPAARAELQQGSGALIVRSNDQPKVIAGNPASDDVVTIGVSLQVVGSVSGQGSYQTEARPLDMMLLMQKVNGRWLFAAPPPSVLIRDSDFSRAFRPVLVYFAARAGDYLIPERRYVDSSIGLEAIATPIVHMLLNGASPWLDDVTRSTLPFDVRLRGNVTVQNEDTIVDFSPELESATPKQINTFAAQIGWSLRRYRTGALHIQVSGRRVAVTGVQTVQTSEDWAAYNPAGRGPLRLYAVHNGAIRVLGSGNPPAFGGETGKSNVISAAISLNGQSVAIVRQAASSQELWIGPAKSALRLVLKGAQISRPTWGRVADGILVTVDGQLRSVTRDGHVRSVLIDEVAGPILQVRLAYDGVRIAFTAGGAGQVTSYVGLLVPAAGEGLSEPSSKEFVVRRVRQLQVPVSSVEDVGWSAATTVVIAGREPDGTAAVWEVELDGAGQTATPRNGLQAANVLVAAAPTEPIAQPIFLQLGNQLFQRFRESWTLAPDLSDAVAPFYPG